MPTYCTCECKATRKRERERESYINRRERKKGARKIKQGAVDKRDQSEKDGERQRARVHCRKRADMCGDQEG